MEAYPKDEQPYDLLSANWEWERCDDQHYFESKLNKDTGKLEPQPNRNRHYYETNLKSVKESQGAAIRPKEAFLVRPHYCRSKRYSPMSVSEAQDCRALFKEFAEMQDSDDSYLDFADRFGFLDVPAHLWLNDASDVAVQGEPLYFWRKQHWLMRYALKLWDWIKENSFKESEALISWDDKIPGTVHFKLGGKPDIAAFIAGDTNWNGKDKREVVLFGPATTLIQCREKKYEWFVMSGTLYGINASRNDLKLPALKILQGIANAALFLYPVKSMLKLDEKTEEFTSQIYPSSLLALMWWQLSQFVSGEKELKQCPICLHWADVTDLKGTWKKHRSCANKDRVTKGRKIKVIEKLLSGGLTIHEISQQLNLKERHIERWLKEEEESGNGRKS